MKVVFNNSYGGFTLPKEYMKLHPEIESDYCCWGNYKPCSHRTDPELIAIVENPDIKTWSLVIAEVPDDMTYRIDEYDGWETVVPEIDIANYEARLREQIAQEIEAAVIEFAGDSAKTMEQAARIARGKYGSI